ncbi:uncharacterized protein LOC5510132 [Nematostella vectensis]|uniref:uncharacterized protein LOC5510132 n=1 Tax=Nematostella vectensis TaxID=45351 RepID=UPI002076EAE7|nr:uncharacterized protein LOC5510132 [Nematostella vectensis]
MAEEGNIRSLIEAYFHEGFENRAIVETLNHKHGINISTSTLKRRLKNYGLRRKDAISDGKLIEAIRGEMMYSINGELPGYRNIWKSLRRKHHIHVTRRRVAFIVRDLKLQIKDQVMPQTYDECSEELKNKSETDKKACKTIPKLSMVVNEQDTSRAPTRGRASTSETASQVTRDGRGLIEEECTRERKRGFPYSADSRLQFSGLRRTTDVFQMQWERNGAEIRKHEIPGEKGESENSLQTANFIPHKVARIEEKCRALQKPVAKVTEATHAAHRYSANTGLPAGEIPYDFSHEATGHVSHEVTQKGETSVMAHENNDTEMSHPGHRHREKTSIYSTISKTMIRENTANENVSQSTTSNKKTISKYAGQVSDQNLLCHGHDMLQRDVPNSEGILQKPSQREDEVIRGRENILRDVKAYRNTENCVENPQAPGDEIMLDFAAVISEMLQKVENDDSSDSDPEGCLVLPGNEMAVNPNIQVINTTPRAKVSAEDRVSPDQEINDGVGFPDEVQVQETVQEENRLHTCEKCGLSFEIWDELKEHVKVSHEKVKIYVCDHCDKEFETSCQLGSHKKVAHDQETAICAHCNGRFPASDLLSHVKMFHRDEKLVKCNYCKKRFTKYGMKEHIEQVHNKPGFKCAQCNQMIPSRQMRYHAKICFSASQQMQNNQMLRAQEKQVTENRCKRCNERFNTFSDLSKHLDSDHEIEPRTCEYCGKVFTLAKYIPQHLKSLHNHPAPFECNYCVCKFQSQNSLSKHVLGLHMNKNICFSSKEVRFIQGEESESLGLYVCIKCNEACESPSELETHLEAVHKRPPSRRCDVCNTYLSSTKALALHMMLCHGTWRPYQCQYCGYYFKCETSIIRHMESNHIGVTPAQASVFEQAVGHRGLASQSALRNIQGVAGTSKQSSPGHEDMHQELTCGTVQQQQFSSTGVQPQQPVSGLRSVGVENRPVQRRVTEQKVSPSEPEADNSAQALTQLKIQLKIDEVRPFKCKYCVLQFESKKILVSHLLAIHLKQHTPFSEEPSTMGNKAFHLCTKCKVTFSHFSELLKHTKSAHNYLPSDNCEVCHHTFSSAEHVSKHFWTAHVTKRPYKCQDCGYYFQSEDDVLNHIKRNHPDLIPLSVEEQVNIQECLVTKNVPMTHSPLEQVAPQQIHVTDQLPIHRNPAQGQVPLHQIPVSIHAQLHHYAVLQQVQMIHNPYLHDQVFQPVLPQQNLVPNHVTGGKIQEDEGQREPASVDEGQDERYERQRLNEVQEIEGRQPDLVQEDYIPGTVRQEPNFTAVTMEREPEMVGEENMIPSATSALTNLYSLEVGQSESQEDLLPNYECRKCGKWYNAFRALVYHMKTVHDCLPPTTCDLCGKEFKNAEYMTKHIRMVHHKLWPYRCEHCHRQFPSKVGFDRHNRLCHLCGTVMKMAKNVTKHVLMCHGGNQPYKCKFCGCPFSSKKGKTRHVKLMHCKQRPPKICKRRKQILEELIGQESGIESEMFLYEQVSQPIAVQDKQHSQPIAVPDEQVSQPIAVQDKQHSQPIAVLDEQVSQPITVLGDQVLQPIAVQDEQVSQPITVLGDQVSQPIAVQDEQVSQPIAVLDEQVSQPITVLGDQVSQPIAVLDEQVSQPITVLGDQVSQPIAVQDEQVSQPIAVLDEQVSQPIAVLDEQVSQRLTVLDEQVSQPISVPEEQVSQPISVPEEQVSQPITVQDEHVSQLIAAQDKQHSQPIAVLDEQVSLSIAVQDEHVSQLIAAQDKQHSQPIAVPDEQVSLSIAVQDEHVSQLIAAQDKQHSQPIAVLDEQVSQPIAVLDEQVSQPIAVLDEQVSKPLTVLDEQVSQPISVPEKQVSQPITVPDEQVSLSIAVQDEHVSQLIAVQDKQNSQPIAVPDEQVSQPKAVLDEQVSQPKAVLDEQVSQPITVPNEQVSQPITVPDEQVSQPITVLDEQILQPITVPDEQVSQPITVPDEQVSQPITVQNKQDSQQIAVQDERTEPFTRQKYPLFEISQQDHDLESEIMLKETVFWPVRVKQESALESETPEQEPFLDTVVVKIEPDFETVVIKQESGCQQILEHRTVDRPQEHAFDPVIAHQGPASITTDHEQKPTKQGLPKGYKCSKCSDIYQSFSELSKHMKAIHGCKPTRKCDLCGKRFSRPETVSKHILQYHEARTPHQCQFCPYNFPSEAHLKRHIKKTHKPGQKDFRIRGRELNHLRRTRGTVLELEDLQQQPVFEASENEMPHFQLVVLEQQESTHERDTGLHQNPIVRLLMEPQESMASNEVEKDPSIISESAKEQIEQFQKSAESPTQSLVETFVQVQEPVSVDARDYAEIAIPHNCIECGEVYLTFSEMSKHMKAVHNSRPSSTCHVCGKILCKAEYVAVHVKMVHERSRPHQCEYCATRFASKSSLSLHIRKFHKITKHYISPLKGPVIGRAIDHERDSKPKQIREKLKPTENVVQYQEPLQSQKLIWKQVMNGQQDPGLEPDLSLQEGVLKPILQRQEPVLQLQQPEAEPVLRPQKTVSTPVRQPQQPVLKPGVQRRQEPTGPAGLTKQSSQEAALQREHEQRLRVVGNEQGELPFQCTRCRSRFASFGEMSKHMRTLHNTRPSKTCNLCQKTFCTAEYVWVHNKMVHERSRPYRCEYCGWHLASKSNLTLHIKRIHKRTQSDTLASELQKEPLETVVETGDQTSKMNDGKSTDGTVFNQQIVDLEQDKGTQPNQVLNQYNPLLRKIFHSRQDKRDELSFYNQRLLESEQDMEHKDDSVCRQQLENTKPDKEHEHQVMSVVPDKRAKKVQPLLCQDEPMAKKDYLVLQADARHLQAASLQIAGTRSPQTPIEYKCNKCSNSYVSFSEMKKHMRTVHNCRPSKTCELCGKKFCTPEYVAKHVSMVHGKERPYRCIHCDRGFTSKINLTNHPCRSEVESSSEEQPTTEISMFRNPYSSEVKQTEDFELALSEDEPATEQAVDVDGPTIESIFRVDTPAVKPIVSVDGPTIEPIVRVDATTVEPIISVHAPTIEPIVRVDAPTVKPSVSVDAPTIEPIVRVDALTVEPIVSVDAHTIEPIVRVDGPAVEPIVSVDAPSNEPTVGVDGPAIELIASTYTPTVKPVFREDLSVLQPDVMIPPIPEMQQTAPVSLQTPIEYKCNKCSNSYVSFSEMKKHMSTVHNCRPSKTCELCGKMFCTPEYVAKHVSMVHGKMRPYRCIHCDRRFTSKINLTNHPCRPEVQNSSDERPTTEFPVFRHLYSSEVKQTEDFELALSDDEPAVDVDAQTIEPIDSVDARAIEQIASLDDPTIEPTVGVDGPAIEPTFSVNAPTIKPVFNEDLPVLQSAVIRPPEPEIQRTAPVSPQTPIEYKCNKCRNSYVSFSEMKKHMSTVHHCRPSKTCELCSKMFCRPEYVAKHVSMVHEKERPYRCIHCDRRFTSKINLTNHPCRPEVQSSSDEQLTTEFPVFRHLYSSEVKQTEDFELALSDDEPAVDVDAQTIEPIDSVDACAIEPIASLDDPTIEPTDSVDACAIEPIASLDDPTIEPTVGVDGPAVEPTFSVNAPTIKPVFNEDLPVLHPDVMIPPTPEMQETAPVSPQTPIEYKCNKCSNSYVSFSEMKKHMRTVHNCRPSKTCELCGKMFCTPEYVAKHVSMVHGKMRPYRCIHCDRGFTSKINLTNHPCRPEVQSSSDEQPTTELSVFRNL